MRPSVLSQKFTEHRERRRAPAARRDDREYPKVFKGGATPRTGMPRRSNASEFLTQDTTAEAGFTLVEVLVALVVIALGLAALMLAVSGTANASGYLRDKALAQMIAMNRITEVRLGMQKPAAASATGNGTSSDAGELDFANRHWHYDTRYFDTQIPSMQRVVVRVWAGTAETKSNPLGEYIGFTGKSLGLPGGSNVDWTLGSLPPIPAAPGAPGAGTTPTGNPGTGTTSPTTPSNPITPNPR